MNFDVEFEEQGGTFDADFGEVHNLSDGGYEQGYAAGYAEGYADGIERAEPLGNLSKYVKVIAKPQTATSFVIENPLGGIAKKVFVQAISEPTSSVDIRKYIADRDLGIGVIELASLSSVRRYTSSLVNGTPNNGEFAISDGVIRLYRFNSSNDWDAKSEYEVEIYQ